MGENDSPRSDIAHGLREAAIREHARRQAGHVTRSQLLELGLTNGGIGRRLARGALIARYTGVYALPPARQDAPAIIAAAVLACGPHALASHSSAAFLWGFLPRFKSPPEISLPTGDRRPRHILTHRCPSLDRSDSSLQLGVKTTAPARTLLDLAPRLSHKERTRLVNDALRSKLLRQPALQDVITRNRLNHGATLLKPFLDLPGQNPTNSS